MLTFTVEGLGELERRWADELRRCSDDIRAGVEGAAAAGVAEAKGNHAFTNRTGALEGSISYRVEVSTQGGAVAVMVARKGYASFVEGGTGPHVIEARRASALRWVGGDGQVHFARSVNHPGSKPHPFMGPAYLTAERTLWAATEAAAQHLADRMNAA